MDRRADWARALSLRVAQDKGVDRICDPIGPADFRNRRLTDGLIGPIVAVFVRDCEIAAPRGGTRGCLFRPWRTHLHPLGESGDLPRVELAGGGHFEAAIIDGVDHRAGGGISGDDRHSRFAALEQGLARVETQSAFMVFARVTLLTRAGEDGTDLRLEEFHLVRRHGSGRRRVDRAVKAAKSDDEHCARSEQFREGHCGVP